MFDNRVKKVMDWPKSSLQSASSSRQDFGFVITSDAIRACTRRHIEVIITDASQSFAAIYTPYALGNASRNGLTVRARQFAALADQGKRLRIARDIVRRKIVTEGHARLVKEGFLGDLAACKSTIAVRHVEAKAAQDWWRRWKDFPLSFVKGSSRLKSGGLSKRGISGESKERLESCPNSSRRDLPGRRSKPCTIS